MKTNTLIITFIALLYTCFTSCEKTDILNGKWEYNGLSDSKIKELSLTLIFDGKGNFTLSNNLKNNIQKGTYEIKEGSGYVRLTVIADDVYVSEYAPIEIEEDIYLDIYLEMQMNNRPPALRTMIYFSNWGAKDAIKFIKK